MIPDIVKIKRLCASGQWIAKVENGKILLHDTVAGETVCIGKTEAEPVRHGRWEWYEEPYDSWNPDGDFGWRCSCCKQDLNAELTLGIPGVHYIFMDDPDNPPTLKRCLFCGAKMDGGAEDG